MATSKKPAAKSGPAPGKRAPRKASAELEVAASPLRVPSTRVDQAPGKQVALVEGSYGATLPTHQIQVTMRPDLTITVNDDEYQELLAMGLVYSGSPVSPAADSNDLLFADKVQNGPATKAALGAAYDARSGRTISPMQYGATGDGTADDTTAVVACLNDITPGTTVVFSKPHKVTTSLSVSGKSKFTIRGGSLLSFAATATSANGAIAALSLSGCTDFRVEGLRLDIATQSQQYNGIQVGGASSNGVVTGCKVTNARWVGISVFDATPGSSTNIIISDNVLSGCRYGISVNGKWIKVSNNLVATNWLSTSEATVPWVNTSLYWDGIIVGTGCTESAFTGNIVIEPGQSGIYGATVTNCTFTGNTVVRAQNKGYDFGPPTVGGSGIVVTGNLSVDGATGDFHFYKMSDSVITGNTAMCTDTSYFGAQLNRPGIILNNASPNNTISGNSVRLPSSATAAGIFVNAVTPKSTGNVISGNMVDAPTKFSINTTDNTLIDPSTLATMSTVGAAMAVGNWYTTGVASVGTGIPPEATERAIPVIVGRTCTIDQLACSVTTAGTAGALIRLGIRADDGTGAFPGTLLADGGTVDGSTIGDKTVTLGSPLTVTVGTRIWLTGTVQGAAATRPTVRQNINTTPLGGIGDASAGAVLDSTLTGAQANAATTTGALPSTQTWFHTANAARVAAHVSA